MTGFAAFFSSSFFNGSFYSCSSFHVKLLLLPGLYNSGPQHWQSLWESSLPNVVRVQQDNWDQPELDLWMARLTEYLDACKEDVILVAHSLGCALAVHWISSYKSSALHVKQLARIKGALLVAPPDVGQTTFPASSFSPMPELPLSLPVKVIASDNDPWCDIVLSRHWAHCWEAEFHSVGALGHINGESGLGSWEQGQAWVAALSQNVVS